MKPDQIRAARERLAASAAANPPRWNIEQDADTTRSASLHLYGVVGGWWGDIDATTLVPAIRDLDVDDLAVYINSPGGDVYDGIAIRNALRGHNARVTVTIDGLAASAASFIALAGDDVVISDGAEIMIHDAWTIALGNADDLRTVADDLDRISDNIASMYAKKAGGTTATWRARMKDETWYSAEEAVAAGLADRLDTSDDEADDAEPIAAEFDLSMYAHAGRAAAQAPLRPAAMATPRKDHTMDPEEFAALQESVTDMSRQLAVLNDRGIDPEPVRDERSAGEWLRALAMNDADTVAQYEAMVADAYAAERPQSAYTGGTSADGILNPQWVGDTIRLIEAPNVLGPLFATGTLPSKGLTLEYGVLTSDDVDVDEQLAEGDDLAKGSITIDTDNAPIKTYGGHVELTRQKIERTTNVNLLSLHLRALALRAGRRKATVLRAHYESDVTSAVTASEADNSRAVVVSDFTDYIEWVSGIVDAAELYQDLGLAMDAMVVDKVQFKNLASLVDTSGRPLMRISGTGVNTVGEISPRALGGDIAGVTVRVNLKQTAAATVHADFSGASFIASEAIRQYNGAITELADENIVNLSKRFGLYYYASLATEIPEAIIPVVAAYPTP